MDTGEGRFEMLDEEDWARIRQQENAALGHLVRNRIFSVGEEVRIKDSKFRIVKITPKKLTLRLLPRKRIEGERS